MKSPSRILTCVDLSGSSEPVVAAAVVMAQAFKAVVHVLHVNEPFAHPTTGGEIPVRGQTALAHDFVDDALARISERLSAAGLACVTDSLEGSPSSVIVEQAERLDADLILVGTHGRGGPAHALLGSVAERVVQKARRPVLVVPVGGPRR
jgi:nucleotide-binding universal stress UspA family protein